MKHKTDIEKWISINLPAENMATCWSFYETLTGDCETSGCLLGICGWIGGNRCSSG